MTLPSLPEIAALLACPRRRAPLERVGDHYRCTRSECAYCRERRFAIVRSWPILVNFDHSILAEDEVQARMAGSAIARPRPIGWRMRVAKAFSPSERISERNMARLHKLLSGSNPDPLLLVIGGGTMGSGTEPLYCDPSLRIVGTDIYGTSLTQFVSDGHQIPLADASVDAVLIQAVLEHVLTPWQVVEEIHRVLKKNGLVYAETPFLQQVHEGPYDFTRFTESGHRYLFKRFETIESGVAAGPGTQLLWSLTPVSGGLFHSGRIGSLVRTLFYWLCWIDRLIPAAYAIDSASAVYFMGRRSEREITPHEMVTSYRGVQRPIER